MEKVNVAIILDTRRMLKENKYPVRLRLTNRGKRKTYLLGKYLSSDTWARVHGENPRGENRELLLYFAEIETKALNIIENLRVFSFEKFELAFNESRPTTNDLFTLFEEYISFLNKEERISTRNGYKDALSSFKKFADYKKRNKFSIYEITCDWLKEFEKWKVAGGASTSTVGVYARYLRNIINIEIKKKNFDQDDYPFGKGKYVIPATRNVKKALTIKQIKKLVKYKSESQPKMRARDMWLFSYLASGINMKDIAQLKFKDLGTKTILFIRSKTEQSLKKELKPIIVPILPELMDVIHRWGNPDRSPNNYVFDIIKDDMDAETKHLKIKQSTKVINDHLKEIGQELKIKLKLTTYVARHSYATVLKRSGASMELISENLGHKDLHTTENYLDSFEDKERRKYQKKLLKF